MKTILSHLLIILSFISISFVCGQTVVNGRVTDTQSNPLMGANIFLKGTYDGSSSNEEGLFSFETTEEGMHTLVVSFLTFETYSLELNVSQMVDLRIRLKEDVNTLDAVILSAGSFAAGDNSKINALKPLDVVTTASALGDFVGALQTLPGTTTIAEDGRLFIRGGQAEETQIFIDGIRVFNPFSPTTNNIPTRGRYSPFLFDGITFSTGGYSAEFGQALSGVLLLNTIDEPDQEKTEIGLMSVGGNLGNTQKWSNSSLSLNGSYINLAPYIALFPDRNEWAKPFVSGSGELVFRRRFENGLFKFYSAFDSTGFELIQEDINYPDGYSVKLNNDNFYLNTSYKGTLENNWSIMLGSSLTFGKNKIDVTEDKIKDNERSFHSKLRFKKRFTSRLKLTLGAEYLSTNFNEKFQNEFMSPIELGFKNNFTSIFTETDIFFSKRAALKAGLRLEYGNLFRETTLSPRLSFALKSGDKGQFSLAYGHFYQSPINEALKFNDDLKSQRVDQYILNYQFNKAGQIFRTEAYYKDYSQLIRYNSPAISFYSEFNNTGYGDAAGVDVFWRDGKSINNLDYWISYSYLDAQRLFNNYPVESQPEFTIKHNLAVVGKYWVDSWKSQLGFSYVFASGRPYTDKNTDGFLTEKTKSYNSLSINWAYLIDQQKILYLSVNNVLNFKNINSYQFADTPDLSGFYDSRALKPAADQFFFVGFFWTISADRSSNQLDNL
ncbi:MAG: TonB-dependent receptor plug domain-containing protein [Flavobacteriaceae bacterium]|nr:TonB-dependent receptor plug domain-containing protein [Flavobacteriaceae bacterium]